MVDEVDRARMAALILEEKDAEEELEAAREAVLLWVKRGRLAADAGKAELVAEAKARALEAKQTFLEAEAKLERVGYQKKALRRASRRVEGEPTLDAELLVEQFRMRGFDPAEQEATEIAQRMQAELELKELRGESAGVVVAEAPTPPTTVAPPDEPPSPSATGAEEERAVTDEEIAALERELAALRQAEPTTDQAPPETPESPESDADEQ